MASGNPLSIVWLRRDLRLHDHAALAHAAKIGHAVQPVFVFDSNILARFTHRDDRRLTLIVRALCAMHKQLARQGSGVLAFYGRPQQIMPGLCQMLHASHLVAAGDVEPDARKRDEEVKQALGGSVHFSLVKDHIMHAAHEVLKDDGTPYKVFTPYSKAWRTLSQNSGCFEERSTAKVQYAPLTDINHLEGFGCIDMTLPEEAILAKIGYELADSEWKPEKAQERFAWFVKNRLESYKDKRDMLDEDGTSRLSPYLRFGLLSARECARAALDLEARGSKGAYTWINELIWRDFYSMILAHFPHTPEHEFQQQYVGLPWRHDKQDFKRFCEGMTGFPIVDAAMRELLTTGIMHNRARMIVASFMTKDLQLDWRMGEEHFAQYLMDYDLASNVGGWQWAASTGTDAQPYFRIFNPVLQSKKFDPDGHYIRKFVPELADLPAHAIHEPSNAIRPACYPPPMVDHSKVKEKILSMFKSDKPS